MPELYSATEKPKEVPEAVQTALRNLMEMCEKEDDFTRKRHLYEAKMNDLYWHGFQHIYWNEQEQEFRIPTHEALAQAGTTRDEADYLYDFVTNIFKAHGLSIIAAIGAEVPGVVFSPVHSENPDDIRAANKAEYLGKVIHRVNNSKLHILHALFILFTQHIVCAYNQYKRDKKYGEVNVPTFKKVKQKVSPDYYACQECEYTSELPTDVCPDCGSNDIETIPGKIEDVQQSLGNKKISKGFPTFGIYGVINVKVPSYAADQDACGYLIHYSDQSIAYERCTYPHIRDKIKVGRSGEDSYESSARAPSSVSIFTEQSTNNLVTEKRGWFRPWQYDLLDDEDEANLLKDTFPSGVLAVYVGDVFAEAIEENLDDVWSVTKGDLSRTIHGDPLGKIAIAQQDIENTVDNLLLECLEHSIPITFAESEVLDFETYGQQEVKPGLVYPVKKPPGMASLSDAFSQLKTSTLPKEGTDLLQMNSEKTQFLLGSFPSIFGGPAQGGSKTLGEYTQSRNYALQRLSIPYQLVYYWWAQMTYKAVKMYIAEMLEDDSFTLPTIDGRFETIAIFKDDFKGKFDLLIPESSVELPVTFGQKRAMLQQSIELNSPEINAFLFSPENIRVVLRYLGMDELSSDSEVQVSKTMHDISLLLREEPTEEVDQLTGQPTLIPSVMPEEDLDDDELSIRVLKLFLLGPGQDHKTRNSGGYMNCIARLKLHNKNLEMQAMKEMQQQILAAGETVNPPANVPKEKPNGRPVRTT